MAALTHPCFKAHWIKDRRSQEEAKIKLRQLIQDSTCSPVLEKSKTSLAEEFLLFDEIQPSGRPDDEVDRFLKDRDTSRFQMTYDVQIFSKSLKTLLRSEHWKLPIPGLVMLNSLMKFRQIDVIGMICQYFALEWKPIFNQSILLLKVSFGICNPDIFLQVKITPTLCSFKPILLFLETSVFNPVWAEFHHSTTHSRKLFTGRKKRQ